MNFSQSLEFGNSTLMKIDKEINNVVPEEIGKESKSNEVIFESPTSKSGNKALTALLTRNRSHLSQADTKSHKKETINHRRFRRSKSDSTLENAFGSTEHNVSGGYSEFFESDISFPHMTKACYNSFTHQKASVLRLSEIENSFQDSCKIVAFTKDVDEKEESVAANNSIEENVHKYGGFIYPNDISKDPLWKKDLDMSYQILSNLQQPEDNVLAGNVSLSCMSPGQLKFSLNSSPLPNINTNMSNAYMQLSENVEKFDKLLVETKKVKSTIIRAEKLDLYKSLLAWGLPLNVLREYERKGVIKMFDWQVECLSNPKILFEHCNLVYSAPTSAGKTLVSEILLLKTVIERHKKVLLILPFISVVREKMFYLQDLLTAAGYRAEGFFGGYTPPGGFDSINVAICTIEKANSIVNKLLEQGKIHEIGTVIVDEVHLISDLARGYILELLLAKILYISEKYGLKIQIITMSATLENVELLKKWLNAELYITDFRPVALKEMIKIGSNIYDNTLKVVRSVVEILGDVKESFPVLQNDADHVAQLCIETLVDGCSVLVFCPSKDWCENLATQLAGAIYSVTKQNGEWGSKLKTQIIRHAIENVKQQLRDTPTGLDAVLEKCITYGCSFHHAGLTTEERDIVEASFKSGALKVIVATSTLSSGVNLPARRVIIRTPLFGGKQMSSLTYRQMIGRAGRTGKDILGESILICTESNAQIGKELVAAKLTPVRSCLVFDNCNHLKRALLEVISSGVASSKEDIKKFVHCTLLSVENQQAVEEKAENQTNNLKNISEALDFLIDYEFIRLQINEENGEEYYVATCLGNACLASSIPPTDGLILFAELQKSRRCFVLESELHAVYLVTPNSVCYQLQYLDWLLFLDLWEKLSPDMKKVGELVGVKESFLVRAMRGQTKLDSKLMQIHKRFYIALALQELVNEEAINDVAVKYKCTRGMLQSLQQMSATFAGIVTSFCKCLQWDTLSIIVSQFKERLYFGIHRDLIDLMRLPDLNYKRARVLYDAGVTSLVELANADVLCIEKILYNAVSFDSVKKHDNENEFEAAKRNIARNICITGKTGITVAEGAKLLIKGARKFVQYEIGVSEIKWSQSACSKNIKDISYNNQMQMSYGEKKLQNVIEYFTDKTSKRHKVIESVEETRIDNYKNVINSNEPKTFNETHQLPEDNYIYDDIQLKIKNKRHLKQFVTKITEKNQSEFSVHAHIPKKGNCNAVELKSEKKIINTITDNSIENLESKNKNSLAAKCKSLENLTSLSDTPLPKIERVPYSEKNYMKTDITLIEDSFDKDLVFTPAIIPQIAIHCNNNSSDLDEKAGTSTKAKRLLRAKQLSEIKKEKCAKRVTLQSRQLVNTPEIKKTSDIIDKNIKQLDKTKSKRMANTKDSIKTLKTRFTNENPETPKNLRSLRKNSSSKGLSEICKTKNSTKSSYNRLLVIQDCLASKAYVKNAVESEKFNDIFNSECENNSLDDDILSSQQILEEIPIVKAKSRHTSRILRSWQSTYQVQSPQTEHLSYATNISTLSNHIGHCLKPDQDENIEVFDFSVENSLIKNPIQLNASHILSCSKVDADSSSFKYVDIIDICGDHQLFQAAFREFLMQKRLALCLGMQKQYGKYKPAIGANILLNQTATTKKGNARFKSYEFQIDDQIYLAGIGFCLSENIVYYMNMQQEGSCKELSKEDKCKYLRMLLQSKEHTLLMYDAKEQIKALNKVLVDIKEIGVAFEDPKVANWLLQPDKNHNLYALAQQFAPECSSLVSLCGITRGYNSYGFDLDSAILAKVRSSIESCVVLQILKGQKENLERIGNGQLQKFFKELEMPLQISLCKMECTGFPTNSEVLHNLFHNIIDSIKRLESKIYEMHGSMFNLGSSAAVAKVLGLHRKSNCRISTSKHILEKIDSPISQMIVIYRKLSVTLTKTIQPLLKNIQNERIHGQSIIFTSTGRISMIEPNLQNVARDFEIEMNSEKKIISCRNAFFPADPKRCLISSDFCQLEMRILAHLSQDTTLLNVMKSDKDIFTAIAARWNKISENGVTQQLRNATKQICYGVVYGMGIRALAERLKCTEEEAKIVSEQFHATYPGVRSYKEKVLKFARNNGYVETITGRRRYLENINSEEALLKNQSERQAVNSAIQGSAADIAKSAILRAEKNIAKYRQKLCIEPHRVNLVLHLHDELIYEVPEDKAKKIAKLLRLTMENCVKLDVPLKVKLKTGKSWGELKEVNF